MEGIKFICILWILLMLDLRKMNCQHSLTYGDISGNDKLTAKDYQRELQSQLHFINHIAHGLEEKLHMLLSTSSLKNDEVVNIHPMLLDTNMNAEEDTQYNISMNCLKNLFDVAKGTASGSLWAVEMMDSEFKPLSGILRGNLQWLGNYDECVAVSVHDELANGTHFKGKFCAATVGSKRNSETPRYGGPELQVVVGLCLPDSCSEGDNAALVNTALYFLHVNENITTTSVRCETHKDLSGGAITAIVLLSTLGMFLALGTGYDIFLANFPYFHSTNEQKLTIETSDLTEDSIKAVQPKPGRFGEILLAFSMYTNGKKLLSTQQGSASLGAIHGVRFLSMSWIILGHTIFFGIDTDGVTSVNNFIGTNKALIHSSTTVGGNPINVLRNLVYIPSCVQRWTCQVIANASFSVDTFFVISGLLLVYLTMNRLQKNKGKLDWSMYYFHRFWRLTPALGIVMLAYTSLEEYWSDGPLWPLNSIKLDHCKTNWWINLLYMQNFFALDETCMGWTWYLADDMQFYIISPLIILPLFLFPILGVIIIFALLLGSVISVGVITRVNDFGALLFDSVTDDSHNVVYVKPWCRIGAYVIGMLTGYILHKKKLSFQIKWYTNLLCWGLATAVALAVIYGLTDVYQGNVHLSHDVAALYKATSRVAWSLSVSWLVFACCTGNGGFINTILSWEAFIPLSRLTYMAYLIHPIIMRLTNYSRRTLFYLTDMQYVLYFLGFLVSTYLVSFVLSIAFESPMMSLEKVLLKKKKKT